MAHSIYKDFNEKLSKQRLQNLCYKTKGSFCNYIWTDKYLFIRYTKQHSSWLDCSSSHPNKQEKKLCCEFRIDPGFQE